MINLIPSQLRKDRQFGRRNRVLVTYVIALATTALLVAIVMIGSLEFFGTDEGALTTEIQENETSIAALRSSTSQLNETVVRLQTVDQLYESSVKFSELIPNIGSILPEGTILNGLSLVGGSTDALSLDVDMERPELAATLVRNLVDSDIFEAADVGNINPKGSDGDRYRYGTSITTSFEGTAEAKAKAAAAEAAKKAALEAEALEAKEE